MVDFPASHVSFRVGNSNFSPLKIPMIGVDYSFLGKRPIFCGATLLLVLGSGNGQIVTDCMCFP